MAWNLREVEGRGPGVRHQILTPIPSAPTLPALVVAFAGAAEARLVSGYVRI